MITDNDVFVGSLITTVFLAFAMSIEFNGMFVILITLMYVIMILIITIFFSFIVSKIRVSRSLS